MHSSTQQRYSNAAERPADVASRLDGSSRHSAHGEIARHQGLPPDVALDIDVELGSDAAVTLLVRDRHTGKLIGRIPERDARGLFASLRRDHSGAIDRSL
jgi:hypothetical protein